MRIIHHFLVKSEEHLHPELQVEGAIGLRISSDHELRQVFEGGRPLSGTLLVQVVVLYY